MKVIKDVDLIWHTDEYDVILVGTNVYNMLSNGFQSKMRYKYPSIEYEDNKTLYGDRRKYGTNLVIPGKPTICLMYFAPHPSSVSAKINYGYLESCLRNASEMFRGKKIATTMLGCTSFDGNGDRERIIALMEDIMQDIDFHVYDYVQLKRHKEIGIVMRRILSNGLEEKTKEILTKLYLIKNGQDSETEKELLS